jgi:hypothetical protein
MTWLSDSNRFLTVNAGVVLTDVIDPVIHALDTWFESNPAVVTSGLRTAEQQLSIIRHYAVRFGLARDYPDMMKPDVEAAIDFQGRQVYAWQPVWSALLNRGVIINPPLRAEVLFDYWKDGVNKKGRIIPPSAHFNGTCFDIGGGPDHDVSNELAVINAVVDIAKPPGMVGFLVERKNNCIHIDCKATT